MHFSVCELITPNYCVFGSRSIPWKVDLNEDALNKLYSIYLSLVLINNA